jgi:transcriptional regulator with XRE-family HTH domain
MQPPSRAGVMRAFGRTIRELRERTGISQEGLALEAAVSRRYMSGLEQGRHNPTLELVCRLMPALKTNFVTFAARFEAHLREEKTGRH